MSCGTGKGRLGVGTGFHHGSGLGKQRGGCGLLGVEGLRMGPQDWSMGCGPGEECNAKLEFPVSYWHGCSAQRKVTEGKSRRSEEMTPIILDI